MRKLKYIFTGLLALYTFLPANSYAGDYSDSLIAAAEGVVADQSNIGVSAGSWAGETSFTGTMLAGLVKAYEATGNSDYLDSAVDAAEYIEYFSSQGLYGDEVYGLSLLGNVQADTQDNRWTNLVSDYFAFLKSYDDGEGNVGTAGYLLNYYAEAEASSSVYYVSHLAMAAYAVNADDKVLYRNAVIKNLGRIADNTATYPVLSLEVAIWALAETGDLDNTTFVNPAALQWVGFELSELPGLLMSHQINEPGEGQYDGTFYWRFDHMGVSAVPVSAFGYTEELVYGVLALEACLKDGFDCIENVAVARKQLDDCVFLGANNKGIVYDNRWMATTEKNYYAAELLQAMAAVKISGDVSDDGCVNLIDFGIVAGEWMNDSCSFATNEFCGGTDINMDGSVDIDDLAVFVTNWLVCYN